METKIVSRIREIKDAAQRILDCEPDPAVRFLLLRNVLQLPSKNSQLRDAYKNLQENIWIKQLRKWQCDDGGWGRFHSSASKTDSPVPKTEFAVDRALALGLRKDDPLFDKADKYITGLLQEKIVFPDLAEKNERWPIGWRLFCAGTLAKFNPKSKVLDKPWRMWAEIAQRTFTSGKYDPEGEILAHAELSGAPADLRYLKIDNKYSVSLIGARTDKLAAKIEKAMVTWLWNKKNGIMYYCMDISVIPKRCTCGAINRWLCSHELLSIYPTWRKFAVKTIDWLWTQQNKDGLWDFGLRDQFYLPLSATWRNRQNRINDWSTRILMFLNRFESR